MENKKCSIGYIQHNIYFMAWLKVVKSIDVVKVNNNYYVQNIDKEDYDKYKIEYKKYKKINTEINKESKVYI